MEIPVGFAFASCLKCLGHNKKSFWYPILEEDIPTEDSGISDKKSNESRKLAQMGIFCQTVIELSVYVAMLVSIGLLKEVSRKTGLKYSVQPYSWIDFVRRHDIRADVLPSKVLHVGRRWFIRIGCRRFQGDGSYKNHTKARVLLPPRHDKIRILQRKLKRELQDCGLKSTRFQSLSLYRTYYEISPPAMDSGAPRATTIGYLTPKIYSRDLNFNR